MSSLLFITALMIWAVAALTVIAGFYLIQKINKIERDMRRINKERYDLEEYAKALTAKLEKTRAELYERGDLDDQRR